MRILLILLFGWIGTANAQISMQGSPFFQPSTSDRPQVAKDLQTSLTLASDAFGRDPKTLDCGCTYNTSWIQGPVGLVQSKTCGFQSRTSTSTPPMARWGRLLSLDTLSIGRQCSAGLPECRDQMGRSTTGAECCLQVDPEFKTLSLDAWNWAPMIVEIDDDRSDFRFNDTPGGAAPYGKCGFRIDPVSGTVEPDPKRRGAVARALLYFHHVWNIPMSSTQLSTYEQWNMAYPPSREEEERAILLETNQRFQNPYYHTRR